MVLYCVTNRYKMDSKSNIELLDELLAIEGTITEERDNSLFPFAIQAVGANQSIIRESSKLASHLPLGLGPFGAVDIIKDLEEKYLKPSKKSSSLHAEQQFFDREIDLRGLMVLDGPSPVHMEYVLKRDLKTGKVSIADAEEVTVQLAPKILENDTPFNLIPSAYLDCAPGLEKGIVYDSGRVVPIKSLDISQLVERDDTIMASLIHSTDVDDEETIEVPEVEKDVDQFLPTTVAVIKEVKKKGKRKEWAQMVDIDQGFPEFDDLVPDMAHKFPFVLDTFQKRAVYHLEQSESVFVAGT